MKTVAELGAIPITRLSGCGPKVEERLGMLSIETVLDLLTHYPRRYLDRTRRANIADLKLNDEATVIAEVTRVSGRRTRNGKSLVDVVIDDGDARMHITFFNQSWREKQLPEGTEASFFGKVTQYRDKMQMTNPAVDVIGQGPEDKTGVVVPIYPQSGKADISTWQLRKLIAEALRRTDEIADSLPGFILEDQQLINRDSAMRQIHQPHTAAEFELAIERLKFDEFYLMQLGLVARKRALEANAQGISHDTGGVLVKEFLARLPFELTSDQTNALDQIDKDLASPIPMHRLLQGEVGSGKTVVALATLLTGAQSGYQGALMAPTEVLAEQHYLTSAKMLGGLTVSASNNLLGERPLNVALLTNKSTAAERKALSGGLKAGEVDIVIGTHALLYDDAPFSKLGVVVIDEQHRFGVEQRSLLRAKGADPDVLVMTATPIPRTAAMLIYGDLDITELRAMPPGRTPITTRWVKDNPAERQIAYETLAKQIAGGQQGFVVCPLVSDSDKIEAKAATAECERLEKGELKGLRVGLLHGQMPASEKEAAMANFRDKFIDVLVATTVIEVGVDIPAATVMIVENADRFGLSQLHQLRGRVGRGGGKSWCFLIADPSTPDGEARLEAMVASTDGFELAEKDLEIRGAGQVFGERQAGFSDLKLGRIPRDEPIVRAARAAAEKTLDARAVTRQLAEEVERVIGDDLEFLFKS